VEVGKYTPNPMTTVQCPRCGISIDVAISSLTERSLEYSGVCTTPLASGGRCGTCFRLVVTAHVFALAS
jgi:hypothetical protein